MEDFSSEILSASNLWKDFNRDLPLKEIKTDEISFDGTSFSSVRFSGREVSGERVKIFGDLATSSKFDGKAILIIPPVDDSGVQEYLKYFSKLGYAVLIIDYTGKREGKKNYTVYPESVNYANYVESGRHYLFADDGAKNTCWYEWTAVCVYAIRYLKEVVKATDIGVFGIKEGSNIAWQLTAISDNIDCFVGAFGAGWLANKGVFKNAPNAIEMNDERYRFIAGVEAQSYAQFVKCPILFLTATNSDVFDVDRQMDTLSRTTIKDVFINVTPRADDYLNAESWEDVIAFFGKYLRGEEKEFYHTPNIDVAKASQGLKINVEFNSGSVKAVEDIKIYISESVINPAKRNWVEIVGAKTEDGVSENLYKFYCGAEIADVFAVVKYKNGLTLSTKIVSKKIKNESYAKEHLIFSSHGKDGGFTAYGKAKNLLGNLFLVKATMPTLAEGPSGIKGITCKDGLQSYALASKVYTLEEDSLIKFDVYSKDYCSLTIGLYAENNLDEFYSIDLELKGMKSWKNVVLKTTDFKSKNNAQIKNYDGVYAITFVGLGEFILNNLLLL